MKTDTFPRVLRVTTLKNFLSEVPAVSKTGDGKSVVRLLNRQTEVELSAMLLLSLQSVNPDGDIVWLCEVHTISWLHGKPFGKVAESAYVAMRDLESIVRGFLESQGYEVRSGDYGLPDNIKPLSASFECARWVQVSEYDWKVSAVDLVEAPQAF